MASAASLSLNNFPFGVDNTQRYTYLRGTISLSAGTYTEGGISINWSNLFKSGGGNADPKVVPPPFQVTFRSAGYSASSISSQVVGGYLYEWNEENDSLQILTASGGSAGTGAVFEEMTNGTSLPAAVLNDTIQFEAIFAKNGAFVS